MDDPQLEAIRQQRMAELQQQQAMQGGMPSGGSEQQQEAEKRQKQQQDARNSILSQCLDQQARARLNTIALTKPDKAQRIEDMILNMARSGRLPGKLNEEQLRNLLERINEQTQTKATTVKFDRRRANLDDSDEDF